MSNIEKRESEWNCCPAKRNATFILVHTIFDKLWCQRKKAANRPNHFMCTWNKFLNSDQVARDYCILIILPAKLEGTKLRELQEQRVLWKEPFQPCFQSSWISSRKIFSVSPWWLEGRAGQYRLPSCHQDMEELKVKIIKYFPPFSQNVWVWKPASSWPTLGEVCGAPVCVIS